MERSPRILISQPSSLVEENCACATSGINLRRTPRGDERGAWTVAPDLYRHRLTDQHTLVLDPCGDSNVVILDEAAAAVLDSFAAPQSLSHGQGIYGCEDAEAHAIALVLAELGLLRPLTAVPTSPLDAPHMLTAWLHITNACNLRCHYCYVNKSDEAMSPETGRAAVDAVFRSAALNGFSGVKLKYAGGEATLNTALIYQLHDYARAVGEKTGVELHEVVLSNGVAISDRFLAFLREERIKLSISVDGVGAVHDAQRAFVNGKGSFMHVQRTVDRAVAQGLNPDLSITVTALNAEHLADAVAFALDRGLRFNLNFFRDNDRTASRADLAAQDQQLIAGVRAAFQVIESRLPRQRLIDSLLDRSAFHAPHERPCGAGDSYLVIDERGGVARCQMEIEHTVTDVMAHDPLALVRAHTDGFQNTTVNEKTGCRDCAWRHWCAGGCPALTFRVTGRNDVKSPYCNVYKTLYPELLRLEGLRLLKWGP